MCAAGYAGALCAACDSDANYEMASGTCRTCDWSEWSWSMGQIRAEQIVLFVGVAVLTLLINAQHRLGIEGWMREAEVLEHMKIVSGFFQVVSPLGSVPSLSLKDYMPVLDRILHSTDALSMDLMVLVRLDCLPVFNSFYSHWYIDVFGAPALMFGAVGISHCWSCWGQTSRVVIDKARAQSRGLCFVLCFLIYLPASQ